MVSSPVNGGGNVIYNTRLFLHTLEKLRVQKIQVFLKKKNHSSFWLNRLARGNRKSAPHQRKSLTIHIFNNLHVWFPSQQQFGVHRCKYIFVDRCTYAWPSDIRNPLHVPAWTRTQKIPRIFESPSSCAGNKRDLFLQFFVLLSMPTTEPLTFHKSVSTTGKSSRFSLFSPTGCGSNVDSL